MKTNTGCLPLKEILAGSKQDTLKWKTKRGASLEGAFCSLFTHINETQTAADTSLFNVLGNTSTLVPCGQKKGWFWLSAGSRQPLSPLLSGASVSSATVLSNKPALPTSWASSLKAPLPNNTETLKKEEREFSCYAASLCAIISIRSLFCPQLVNLTECLSFSAQSAFIHIAVLSAGADTNEALFF